MSFDLDNRDLAGFFHQNEVAVFPVAGLLKINFNVIAMILYASQRLKMVFPEIHPESAHRKFLLSKILSGNGDQPDTGNLADSISEFPLTRHPQDRPAKKAAHLKTVYIFLSFKVKSEKLLGLIRSLTNDQWPII